jgi:protein-S-isoprenylcysteine O-methyltransferase Ste14
MTIQSSLPYGGGGVPYVVVFWATFSVWYVAEISLNTRRRLASPDSRDRGSLVLLFRIVGLALLLGFASPFALPGADIAAARTVFALGMGCVVARTALRWYSVATLKQYFTVNVIVKASQSVITIGPYRYIRHPAYAGQLLALAGFGLAVGNWAGLLAMVVLPSCAFGYRIAIEEAALLSTLGEPYARYMRNTRRFIPGLI